MSNVGARQVGEIMEQRPIVTAAVNPADVATVVSIYGKDIEQTMETLFPSKFVIVGGSYEKPAVTLIKPASYVRDMGEFQPMIQVPVNALQIATSVITDYCKGLLGCDMNDNMPGFFFIPGEVTQLEVTQKYKNQLLKAKTKQENWYRILIRLADGLWARSNNNPLVIWDEMRAAATAMGENRAWIRDFSKSEMVKCFACGNLRNPNFPVCGTCKVIDPNHPAAKDLKFAV